MSEKLARRRLATQIVVATLLVAATRDDEETTDDGWIPWVIAGGAAVVVGAVILVLAFVAPGFAVAAQQGAAPRFFSAEALPGRPLSMRALTSWWKQLQQAARTAEHPLNTGLATEFLVSSAREALNSRG